MKKANSWFFVSAIALLISTTAFSQVRLPRLISDGMVLQRQATVRIWGWAQPSEQVSLLFMDQTYKTKANAKGEWSIFLKNLKVGGPYKMKINASNEINISNILVGDVWVCSGQSNMELTMKRVSPLYPEDIAHSENSNIRQFYVPHKRDFLIEQNDLSYGAWLSANPENVPDFSATAYFFAKELYNRYQVPIGLINSSLGGSPAEAWISEDALKAFPAYYQEAQKCKNSDWVSQTESEEKIREQTWYRLLKVKDKGYKNHTLPWFSPALCTEDWASMSIPGYWSSTGLGPVNGVVWFRKEIDVPASMAGKSGLLILGRIVDSDSTFINGIFIGTTSYQHPPRRYNIPEGLLKEGRNIITVRIISNSGQGGFVEGKKYELAVGNCSINLAGDWKVKLGATMSPLESPTFFNWKPLGLFNAMIHPLLNYRIKGVIWYQGEANSGNAEEYKTLFPALIQDWRKNWSQGDFPFLYVQLPGYRETKAQPGESKWAALREAQLMTLKVKNTGMAITADIGEWNDIHPLNKKDVGKRLFLAARRIAYGEKITASGPLLRSMKKDKNTIILSFNQIGGGLVAKGNGELNSFAISGQDKIFHWAKAKIENDLVIVWCESISNPIAVRYAWADNPEGANLYNKEGLPASPFRTDSW